MTWFKREKKPIEAVDDREDRRIVTEGLWIKCSGCKEPLWKKDLEANVFENTYLDSAATERYMKTEYEQFRAALAELGMTR